MWQQRQSQELSSQQPLSSSLELSISTLHNSVESSQQDEDTKYSLGIFADKRQINNMIAFHFTIQKY
jgi:hypothetical protein